MPSLPSAPDLALGKVFFNFLNSLLSATRPGTQQRGVFLIFLKKSLPSVIGPDTRQRDSFAECLLLTLGKEAPLSIVIF